MIRTLTADDAAGVPALTVAAELFTAAESGIVEAMMASYLSTKAQEGDICIVDELDGDLVGVAYYAPVLEADRTWYLTMIGIRADHHRGGRGRALLQHVEHDLVGREQRLLLVETSSVPAFARARRFYAACGYSEEARVRDYYGDGDDMVLFHKALGAVS